jgi:hypothetical protein
MAPGLVSLVHENFEKLVFPCIYTLHIHMYYILGILKWYNIFCGQIENFRGPKSGYWEMFPNTVQVPVEDTKSILK